MADRELSFSELYEAYAEDIYTFLYYKTFHQPTAEDLTSITFTKALEHFSKFQHKGEASLKSWLYTIARNTAIDYYRTKREEREIDDARDLQSKESLSEETALKITLDEVVMALRKLPEGDQEILTMRLWQELSYKEIASLLGKSEASLKMRFSRALQNLRSATTLMSIIISLILW